MEFFAQPIPVYFPSRGHPDPEILKMWNEMNMLPDATERQQYVLDRVYALPFGSLTKVQAVRSDVKGFVPFRITRMYNVWFTR
jgi:peptide/nickel transport system substrate-binding protein